MKKFKISMVITYAILVVALSSCEESKFPETPSKFIIDRIILNKTKGTSLYLVRPIEQKALNMSETWFVDSVGRFNAGDTIVFQHYH
jgi:hypothetical protein